MSITSPTGADGDWVRRLRYLHIDEPCCERLRQLKPILLSALPDILEKFYRHALSEPELEAKFSSPERVAFAREAQVRHWGLLFNGRFDDAYRRSVDQIGATHYRIGLTPRWYMAGYSFVLDRLQAVVVRSVGGLVRTPARERRLVESLQAVSRAVMLDMELAISRYWEMLAEERRAAVDTMIDRIDLQLNDTVNSIAHVTGDLVHSSEVMTCVSMTVDVSAGSASDAAQDALGSAQTVASAAEELHASIDEIGAQVQRSNATARVAVGRMRDARAVLGTLGNAAREIGKVTKIIGGIAAQTNLPARAAGKGFAVVAGEVRNLASQSAASAKEITQRIDTMQEVSRSAGTVIDEVAGTIEQMEQIAAVIAAAIEEQTAATSEIARAVGETAARTGTVTTLMAGVSENVGKASQASIGVGESAARMEETLAVMRKLLTRAVRTSSAVANRRQRRRRAVLLDAEVSYGGEHAPCVLYDLSECGVLVQTEAAIAQGATVGITIPEEGLRCRGSVVACGDGRLHVHFEEGLPASRVDALAARSIDRICDLARSDHIAFMEKIARAMDGETMSATALATHHTCLLGRWYDSVTDETMLALPAFRALAEPHREVHTRARQVLLALDGGQMPLARTRMEELRASSAKVQSGLEQLRMECGVERLGPQQ